MLVKVAIIEITAKLRLLGACVAHLVIFRLKINNLHDVLHFGDIAPHLWPTTRHMVVFRVFGRRRRESESQRRGWRMRRPACGLFAWAFVAFALAQQLEGVRRPVATADAWNAPEHAQGFDGPRRLD